MLRNIGAVLLGLVVGSILNMLVIGLSMQLHPTPAGFDMADPAQMQAYIEGLPVTALLLAIVAHTAQAVVGGWTAARVGSSAPVVLALIIGVLTVLGSVYNLVTMDVPVWMWIEVPIQLGGAYAVGALEARRRAG